MKPGALDPQPACECGAAIGELHRRGCDDELCARCGEQVVACHCVYELNGMEADGLWETHPDIYENGPTEAMWKVYDAEIEKLGGRIARSPLWQVTEDAARLGLWCRWVGPGTEEAQRINSGWHSCGREHPDAVPHLVLLLYLATWNPKTRHYEVDGQ